MRIGTKSLLFGIHQVFIHPWFVAWGWKRLYGFPKDPRLWLTFFVHDLGYFGRQDMDGADGEQHPELGGKIMQWLFGHHWWWMTACHSRYYAKSWGYKPSPLCAADKLAIALTPAWLYMPLANWSGEIHEYMAGHGTRTPALERTQEEWFKDVQKYCAAWAYEHKDGREDTWTGTKRDEARQ